MRGALTVAVLVAAVGCGGEESTRAPEADALEEQVELLDALGYVGGTELPSGREGVTVHDPEAAWPGLNFYVSGHGAEAILMDMEGRRLHRWAFDFEKLLAARGHAAAAERPHGLDERRHWRRARLLPGGDLLAIHTHFALVRLDRASNLVWAHAGRVHHDLDVLPDGRIYVLSSRRVRLPRFDPDEPVIEDLVVVLDGATGRELGRHSLLEPLERAGLDDVMAILPRKGDLLHTNSLEVLDAETAALIPGARPGNVLVSFLMVNTIAVVDLEAREVVWSLRGDFRLQHDPSPLPGGRMLLFDNFGPSLAGVAQKRAPGFYQRLWYHWVFSPELPERPQSAVLEIDLPSGDVVWEYRGDPSAPLRSETCGTAQRLPNGNTLVTETQFGRAVEVAPDGRLVWEFVSPHRFGDKVAQLFSLERLPTDAAGDWTQTPAR